MPKPPVIRQKRHPPTNIEPHVTLVARLVMASYRVNEPTLRSNPLKIFLSSLNRNNPSSAGRRPKNHSTHSNRATR
ncbi:MAG: hypothetical protein M2R45_03270 [Verrucomicrobia subdivision 3 bacterium]|nr:hypothetical protein [Limisphaerales bacterium]